MGRYEARWRVLGPSSIAVVALAGSLTVAAPHSAAAAARITVRRRSVTAAAVQLASGDVVAPAGATMQLPGTAPAVVASTKLALGWRASDPGSGIGSYDVRIHSAPWNGVFGAFTTWKSATTATSAFYTAVPGHTYCFSMRARDKSGNLSSFSADHCSAVPLDDGSLAAVGFRRLARVSGAFGASLSTAAKAGASLTRTGVHARSITLFARTCTTCGAVAVKWNGKLVKNVSLAGAPATHAFAIVTFAKPAAGTLQIVATSAKTVTVDAVGIANPSISGSITIKGGASYTNTTAVSVSAAVSGASGAVQMRLANGTAAGGAWIAFAANKPFTLAAGDGTKSVAAQFKDAGGNVSTVALDSIVLDTTAPTVAATPGSTEVPHATDVPITATVTDASPLSSVVLETATPGSVDPPAHAAMTLSAGAFHATVAGPTDSFDFSVIATDAAGNAATAPETAPDVRYQVTVDPPPTSQDLIADALAKGTIDYPTSLEYRTWALFDDPQLPDAYYGGGGHDQEDESLALDVADALPTLPPDVQAAIEPYFARPTSAESPYGPTSPAAPALGGVHAADTQPLGPPSPSCDAGWNSVSGDHFKVWSCGLDDPLRQTVLDAADPLYDPETGDMGTEVSDAQLTDNGGDGLIDIYILDTLQCRMRDTDCVDIPGNKLALTIPQRCTTSTPKRCATYIVINRAAAQTATMKGIVAHELFHVLQNAHNLNAMFWHDSGPAKAGHEHWFTEASANWAAWHYAHASFSSFADRFFTDDFQKRNTSSSLVTETELHDYASWVWPLFMQQDGGVSAVVGAWDNSDGVTTPQSFDDVISAQTDFTQKFREFALKNIDQVYDGDPYTPWQKGTEGADLTKNVDPELRMISSIPSGGVPELVSTVDIPVLSAQYDYYKPKPNIGKLTFDFTNVQNRDNLDVDIVGKVRSDGQWRRIKVDTTKFDLCQDLDAQDFEEFWVVLSNHKSSRAADGFSPDESQKIDGDYSITVSPCDAVNATFGYTYSSSGTMPNTNIDQNYNEQASFDVNMKPLDLGPGLPTPYQLVDDGSTFDVSTHYTLDSVDDQGCQTLINASGSAHGSTPTTDPFHPSFVGLNATDPNNPFLRGDVAVFTYQVTYDVHAETTMSGTCSGSTTTDTTTQSQLFTCKPAGVTIDEGGGLYGTYDATKHSYDFTCSVQGPLSPFGVPGNVSITGQVFVSPTT